MNKLSSLRAPFFNITATETYVRRFSRLHKAVFDSVGRFARSGREVQIQEPQERQIQLPKDPFDSIEKRSPISAI